MSARRPRSVRPCPCSHRVSVLVLRRGAAARGATFDIVCPQPPAEKQDQGSNNVKNGTSGERALARLQASARRRAAPLRTTHPPPLCVDRADSGPLAAFSSLRSIGTITRSVPPRSSRRNAPRGPNSSRSRNSASLRFRGAWFGPSAPEVGVAASPPPPLPLRASAAARDTRPSGTLTRTS